MSASTTRAAFSPSSRTGSNSSKERFVHRLFDLITPRYDLFNRIASLGLDQPWRRRTVESLQLGPEARVLDLACGTGDLAAAAAPELVPLGRVVGCDLSLPMMAAGAAKLACRPPTRWHVAFAQGRAEQLPFADGAFQAAMMGFALRNISDLEVTFRELHRVLSPGGRIGLLEFGRPRNPILRAGHILWLSFAVPLIGILTTGRVWPFLYLRRSILGFLSPEEVIRRLEASGFADAESLPLTGGVVRLYTAVSR
ncbi:MAG: ubiquinone/menaquinone biosynthesis methyltransferase [Candidatus Omnitrophica bacterium]|nr:ubiquinone/menaquinone biosynthesis methyltransferase [Candidatus Omnitrophota bacterium]